MATGFTLLNGVGEDHQRCTDRLYDAKSMSFGFGIQRHKAPPSDWLLRRQWRPPFLSLLRWAQKRRPLIAASARLFLPIAGAITLVLLPMALIYENSRRQLTQARMTALVQAGRTQTLHQSSALTEPLSLAGLLLPYLLAAGASLAIARNQQHLASLRLEEQASLERLQAVMGNSGVGMALLDPATGCFRVANLAMCRFFGLTADELQQSSWQELTHPDDLAIDQQRIEQLIAGSINQYRLRKRYRHADGRTIWGDLVVTCTRNPDGSVRDVIGQVSDVSELVAKAAYVEAASQAGVIGIWDWDVPSNQLRWDPVMYQLYGLERGDGRQTIEVWEQALHPDDKPHVLEAVQAALCGSHEFQPRFRVVWPDGSIHHLKSRSRTTCAADGTALRMIGVNYDVTEQAQREEQLDQQRHLLATTLDALLDPVLFLSRDDSVAMLRISELNNAAAVFFARGEDELLGQVLEDLLPQEGNGELHAGLRSVVEGSSSWQADEHPMRPAHAGARPIYADVRAARVPDGVVLSFRDVTSRRLALANLLASEERFRQLAENVSDVVFLTEAGRISWISPGLRVSLGWEPRQWVGAQMTEFCHPNDQSRVSRHLREAEAGRSTRLRLRAHASDNSWHWLELHAGPNRNGEGALLGAVAGFRVIDLEVAAEGVLQRQARTDPLTGLLNRKEILECLERLTWQRRLSDGHVGVLFCDIDNFKSINDSHGHSGGDVVLMTLAERLGHCTRANDLVGRMGGDELLIVLPAIPDLQAAEAIATKIQRNAQEFVALPNGSVSPTLSIGVTLVEPNESVVSVVQRADQAMYAAKQQGRNRVIAFSGASAG